MSITVSHEIVARCTNMNTVSFKSLRFLLVDSKVGRNTKQLVAGVAQKKMEVIAVGFNLPRSPG